MGQDHGHTRRESGAAHFDVVLGLGSNLGDKPANIAEAIRLLSEDGALRLVARSRDWKTPPWGVTDQDWFVNACVGMATRLPPRAVLARCQDVESRMGRVRTRRWGPRLIDVDILLFGDAMLDEPDLEIPHPRIAERAFVLGPLADIAPGLLIAGVPVAERLQSMARSGELAGIHPMDT